MNEEHEEIPQEEKIDRQQLEQELQENFYKIVESYVYKITPLSKELCMITIMTHVGSDFDKSLKISSKEKAIERVENDIRHVSFYATKDDIKENNKIVTITCKAVGTSTDGYVGVWRAKWPPGCHGSHSCKEKCVDDCTASLHRCENRGDPMTCGLYHTCYKDPNC